MPDEFLDRIYRSRRDELHDGIDTAVATAARGFAAGFARLNQIAWKAPWKSRRDEIACRDCPGLA